MATWQTLRVDEGAAGIRRVTLNRPQRRNALNAGLARELADAVAALGADGRTRCLVLAGAGPAFCAGADIEWMNVAHLTPEHARRDADLLAGMFEAVDQCRCPVIAAVHGPAFGGGVGLLAACDIVVAVDDATFALSEARLGLVPALIAPILLQRVGPGFLRRYALTGELFAADVALRAGLIHDVVPSDGLEKRVDEIAAAVTRLAPGAVANTKTVIRTFLMLPEEQRAAAAIDGNVHARLSDEAREGFAAFLAKRPPPWQ
jgi:methylglutaconyl-CoA hydratase